MEEQALRPSAALVAAAIAVAVAAVSTAAVLIRLSQAPSLTIAAYRLVFAAALLAPVTLLHAETRSQLASLAPWEWVGLCGVGVVLAVHFAAWIESLSWTTVAASVALVTLHPVFVALASGWLFDEGLGALGWAGVGVAFGGGVVVVSGDVQIGWGSAVGDGLALVGALAAAAYFLAGRRFRGRLSLFTYVVPVYAASAVTLVLASWGTGTALTGYPWREYALFLALAVVPMVIGHTLLNWALKHVTAPVVATAILGEPVGATVLALLVLGEVPPAVTVLGGAIVLAGIGLVVYEDNQPEQGD